MDYLCVWQSSLGLLLSMQKSFMLSSRVCDPELWEIVEVVPQHGIIYFNKLNTQLAMDLL